MTGDLKDKIRKLIKLSESRDCRVPEFVADLTMNSPDIAFLLYRKDEVLLILNDLAGARMRIDITDKYGRTVFSWPRFIALVAYSSEEAENFAQKAVKIAEAFDWLTFPLEYFVGLLCERGDLYDKRWKSVLPPLGRERVTETKEAEIAVCYTFSAGES